MSYAKYDKITVIIIFFRLYLAFQLAKTLVERSMYQELLQQIVWLSWILENIIDTIE